ncbi:uncharacterized protein BJX67DRAFT_231249 [Aspergillus lucknowensis]|uniref:Uncharacterized protein n=1 Tax=Aspergillus lucknowensis TaxID=176173 RepID=A0ABR4LH49_9EURO
MNLQNGGSLARWDGQRGDLRVVSELSRNGNNKIVLGLERLSLVLRGRIVWAEPPDVKNGDDIGEGPMEGLPVHQRGTKGPQADAKISQEVDFWDRSRPRATRDEPDGPLGMGQIPVDFRGPHAGWMPTPAVVRNVGGWRIVFLDLAGRISQMPRPYSSCE